MKRLLLVALGMLLGFTIEGNAGGYQRGRDVWGGVVYAADGSAAAPSVTYLNDTDTGWFSMGPDTNGFAAGGAQIGYYDANGLTLVNHLVFTGNGSGLTNLNVTGMTFDGTNTWTGTNNWTKYAGFGTNTPAYAVHIGATTDGNALAWSTAAGAVLYSVTTNGVGATEVLAQSTVANGADGSSVTAYRYAAEGNNYVKMYVDSGKSGRVKTDAPVLILDVFGATAAYAQSGSLFGGYGVGAYELDFNDTSVPYTYYGDTDTGMGRVGADTNGFYAGGKLCATVKTNALTHPVFTVPDKDGNADVTVVDGKVSANELDLKSWAYINNYTVYLYSDNCWQKGNNPRWGSFDDTAGEDDYRTEVDGDDWKIQQKWNDTTWVNRYVITGDGTEAPHQICGTNGSAVVTFNTTQGGSMLMKERTAQPADPAEGEWVLWMSDGTGYGDDGDLCIITQAGGVLYTNTIVNVVP